SLIAKHPDFSRRLRPGAARDPRLKIAAAPTEPASDDQQPAASIGYASSALARGEADKAKKWIDTAVLHYPEESAVWFLDAYYNLRQGDRELVRRDRYRAIDIEADINGAFQRKRRYEAAKDIQGPKRDELEKLWQEYWREPKDARKPMTLVPAK